MEFTIKVREQRANANEKLTNELYGWAAEFEENLENQKLSEFEAVRAKDSIKVLDEAATLLSQYGEYGGIDEFLKTFGAFKKGNALIAPCMIGDEVFLIGKPNASNYFPRIHMGTVKVIEIEKDKFAITVDTAGESVRVASCDIGKIAFFTREEAREAMNGKEWSKQHEE